jgi:hypothetical protein
MGDTPVVERWNGTSWSVQRFAAADQLPNSLSCGSDRMCVAVGESTTVERWNGRRWSLQQIRTPGTWMDVSLSNVSCTSAKACIAIGRFLIGPGCSEGDTNQSCTEKPLVERWNGSRWSAQPVPKFRGMGLVSLDDVSCSSPRACMIIATVDAAFAAARWNGSKWSIHRMPRPRGVEAPDVSGVSCGSPRECIVLGHPANGAGLFSEHWDGSRWTVDQQFATPAGGSGVSIAGVSCVRRGGCVAVGGFSNSAGAAVTLAEFLRHSRWSVQLPANDEFGVPASFSGVSCFSPAGCETVGADSASNLGVSSPLAEA